MLEHGERLWEARLLEVGRLGKDDLGDANAGGRVERELRRDQRRVARRIRLNVELWWKPHLHRGTGGAAGADFRLDERGQLGPRAAELRR